MSVKYVIQKYARYPIYEPAEGGYYYEGLGSDAVIATCDTKEETIGHLKKYIEELKNDMIEANQEECDDGMEAEGHLVISSCGTHAYSVNHKYVGEGFEFFVEPINRRGRHSKGRVPYE